MANRNAPFGARLIGHLYGSPYNARIRPYIVSGSDSALYIGDFVKVTGTGLQDELGIAQYPVITAAATTGPITGVIVAFKAYPSNLTLQYNPASTLRTVFVCDDPNAIFEIQTNGIGALTDFEALANFATGTPNVLWGTSGNTLDEATITDSMGGTATQLRILGLSQRTGNAIGQYCVFSCMINDHTFKYPTAAV